MAFGNFLKGLATGVGTFFGGPAGGALAGGIAGYLGSRSQAGAYDRAGAAAAGRANQGFNYLAGSPVGTQYLPAGGAATEQQRALLGLGGDPEEAQRAFEAWQASTGFQGSLDSASRAITGNRAAAGLLGSGSTALALQRKGHQLGQESFSNYFGQLGTLADRGLSAGGMVGQAATAGGVAGAGYGAQAAMGSADARARGFNELVGGLGGAYETWQAGRQPAAISAVPPVSERRMWSARPQLARTRAPNYLSMAVR